MRGAKQTRGVDALGQHGVDGDAPAGVGCPVLLPVEQRELARAQDPARGNQQLLKSEPDCTLVVTEMFALLSMMRRLSNS